MPDNLTTTLGSPLPKGMKTLSLTIGFVLVSSGFYQYVNGSCRPLSYIVVGFVCLMCSSYNKTFSISPDGVVREQKILGRKYREILPWSEVRSVSFAFRGDKIMVLFEKGLKGWRVLFSRDQEHVIRSIILENRPDITIEILSK